MFNLLPLVCRCNLSIEGFYTKGEMIMKFRDVKNIEGGAHTNVGKSVISDQIRGNSRAQNLNI